RASPVLQRPVAPKGGGTGPFAGQSSFGLLTAQEPGSARGRRMIAYTGCEATSGVVVGASTPPERSSVTATTAFLPTGPSTRTMLRFPPWKRPARFGVAPVITHTSYALPAGADASPSTTITARPSGATTSRPWPLASDTERESGSEMMAR